MVRGRVGFTSTGDHIHHVAGTQHGHMGRGKETVEGLIYSYRMGHGGEYAMRRDDEKKRNNEQE